MELLRFTDFKSHFFQANIQLLYAELNTNVMYCISITQFYQFIYNDLNRNDAVFNAIKEQPWNAKHITEPNEILFLFDR